MTTPNVLRMSASSRVGLHFHPCLVSKHAAATWPIIICIDETFLVLAFTTGSAVSTGSINRNCQELGKFGLQPISSKGTVHYNRQAFSVQL